VFSVVRLFTNTSVIVSALVFLASSGEHSQWSCYSSADAAVDGALV
jgi:hypothetical protein